MTSSDINESQIPGKVYLVLNGQIYPITKRSITIGRKLDNDLVLQDALISRTHAEIKFEDNQFILHDMNSTGGTYLNNKKIDKAVLYSGDIILLTHIPIMFMIETDSLKRSSDTETDQLSPKFKQDE